MKTIFLLMLAITCPVFAAEHSGCDLKQAGFKRPKEFEKFFVKLKAAAKDEAALVKMANYPFRNGDNARIKDEAEMRKKFGSVFTPKVLNTIASQKRANLFCNYQGAMIGDGEAWIQEVEGVVVISTINNK